MCHAFSQAGVAEQLVRRDDFLKNTMPDLRHISTQAIVVCTVTALQIL